MRYVVAILLLASPAFAAEPVYSWRFRADDADRVYLYRDGNQIGAWYYGAQQFRPFDGKNWGPPTDTAPVRAPEQRMLVIQQPQSLVVTQPRTTFPPVRGPLRVRLGMASSQIIADMTIKAISEIPRAVADSLARGEYQLDYQFSVTRPGEEPAIQTTAPNPGQPVQTPKRRWAIRRR